MQASILIVSKNRKEELARTLSILFCCVDLTQNEVLVYLDGCTDGSEELSDQFYWVQWHSQKDSVGASSARNELYPKAKGNILIGLDDDAHPLQTDFIALCESIFEQYHSVGVLAFEEIKGIFANDDEALALSKQQMQEYYCNEFIGCGFAIKNEVYRSTDGFPVWIDIYGEESCVAIEVLANGFDILYTNRISVNHRVNQAARKSKGGNYFRFGKQLKNATYYYLVYYPFPVLKIARLWFHNFKKYAVRDWTYFKIYFQNMAIVLAKVPFVLKYRNPVPAAVRDRLKKLPNP